MTPRTPALAAAVAAVALALAGCGGDSKSEKATNNVCDARDDIAKQVDTLKGLTISTATTDQISKSLEAIGNDLKQIKDAQGDLSDDRRSEIQKANSQFETQVRSAVSDLGKSTSLSEAKTQLTAAFQQLGEAYKQTYAKIDCS